MTAQTQTLKKEKKKKHKVFFVVSCSLEIEQS
jgi:hypothetical protein